MLMSAVRVDGLLQCIVGDMTVFYVKGVYYELTLYMDIWNNESSATLFHPDVATVCGQILSLASETNTTMILLKRLLLLWIVTWAISGITMNENKNFTVV